MFVLTGFLFTAGNDIHKSLRKASTQQSIDVPSHVLNNKRSSTSGDIGTRTAQNYFAFKKDA